VTRTPPNEDSFDRLSEAVGWDQVTDYLVFASADRYRARLRFYERRKGKV